MFGRRYFGGRYYGPRYFGDGGTGVAAPTFSIGIVPVKTPADPTAAGTVPIALVGAAPGVVPVRFRAAFEAGVVPVRIVGAPGAGVVPVRDVDA